MSEARQDGGSGVEVRDGLLRLPADRYGRYRLISDVLERLGEGQDPPRVLDVGGEEGALAGFLPGASVTVPGLPATGDALPFENGAFDYAVSVDAYGRVEPGDRERHLSELRRTARRAVLLAAPFDSAEVRGAERVVSEFHRAVHRGGHAQVWEPARGSLPELEDVRRFFEGHGEVVWVLPNGYLPHWLAMTCLASYGSEFDADPGEVFDGVNAFYNEFVYGLDNAEPSYRHLLVSLREPEGADLNGLVSAGPDPERASRSSALFGTLAAILPLAAEVKRLNVGLAQREGALARKEAQVNDLSRRLAEVLAASGMRRGGSPAGLPKKQPDIEDLQQQLKDLQQQLTAITNSRGWRVLTVLHKIRLRISRSG